jgi:sialate O-acetylesterase
MSMNQAVSRVIFLGYVLTVSSIACAEVRVPPIFGNGMVLQRNLPVPVWGTAESGEQVSVSFAGQELRTTTDDEGHWMVTLAPLKTSSSGQTMAVRASNTLTFQRVLVGEVWLCCGQSNMAGTFTARKNRRIDPEVFDMDLSRFRFNGNKGWDTVSEKSQNRLSMVAFYFGYELYKELDIPIGLITRYNSGTPIQAWMPKDASEEIRKQLNIEENWRDPEDKKQRQPGAQYEAKIAPIVPVAFRGAIWYQGERNAKSETGCEYDELLAFHIKTWRERWAHRAGLEVREFPFYYVQVPTQESPVTAEWPWLRDRMRRALDKIENTGMAICYDYGPFLHPENKQPFGRRLALWALANDYGRTDLVHCGPLLDEVHISGSKAILSFRHTGGGLRNKTGEKYLKFFELAGANGEYAPADAWIEGDRVVVQSKEIATPVHVRYLFRKSAPSPEVSLINAEGLPASSFMTDNLVPARTGGLRPAELRQAARANRVGED